MKMLSRGLAIALAGAVFSFALSFFLAAGDAQAQGRGARDVCDCRGSTALGGPCYAGPGGPAYAGPGGPAYAGPGGPCYTGPGGLRNRNADRDSFGRRATPLWTDEAEDDTDDAFLSRSLRSSQSRGGTYRAEDDYPGGPAFSGPGGPAFAGPGGACFAGPGGPCFKGPGGDPDECPRICR